MDRITGVQDALVQWYENRGRLSWQFLSTKVGRSASYISRVAKGEYKPSFEFERDALAYLYQGREREVLDFLKQKYPKKVTLLASLSDEATKKMSFPKPSFYEIVGNRLMYHIYRLSDAAVFTVSEITRMVGIEAPLLIKRMADIGAVEIQNDVVSRNVEHKNQLNINLKTAIDCSMNNLSILARRAEISELGGEPFNSRENKVLGFYENLNEAGVQEAIQRINSTISELRLHLQDPRFQGDMPTFINTAVGRFDDGKTKRWRE